MIKPKSFRSAVNSFIAASEDWLTDADAPAIYTLLALANELDSSDELKSAAVAQFGVAYRSLVAKGVREADIKGDELAEALHDLNESN